MLTSDMIVELPTITSHRLLIFGERPREISCFFITEIAAVQKGKVADRVAYSYFVLAGARLIFNIDMGGGGELEESRTFYADKDYALPILRHSVVGGVEYLGIHCIPELGEFLDDTILNLTPEKSS